MTKRSIPIAAIVACLSFAGTPALATDDPPPATTPPAATPPAPATTAPSPATCTDLTRPRSRSASTAKVASRSHVLRGTALDGGCSNSSVALVSVSISLRQGKRCRYVARGARMTRATTCKAHWVSATGTRAWSLRLPKRMPHGSYQILTRAVDAAGNVERAHARRLAIGRPRSKSTK
jgi:hypothetical protein